MSSEVDRQKAQQAIDLLGDLVRDGKVSFRDMLAMLGEKLNLSHMIGWMAVESLFTDVSSLAKAMLTFGAQPGGMFSEPGSLDLYLHIKHEAIEGCIDEYRRQDDDAAAAYQPIIETQATELWAFIVAIYELPTRSDVLARIDRYKWSLALSALNDVEENLFPDEAEGRESLAWLKPESYDATVFEWANDAALEQCKQD